MQNRKNSKFKGCPTRPGKVFKSLWGIDDNTKGKALIVPSVAESAVSLVHGLGAWIQFSQDLAKGMTAEAARVDTNAWVLKQMDPAIGNNPPQAWTEQWSLIGDKNAKIK